MADTGVYDTQGGFVRTKRSGANPAASESDFDDLDVGPRWPVIVVLGTTIAVVGISYVTTVPFLGIVLSCVGLLTSMSLQRKAALQSDRAGSAYDGVVAIGLDLLTLYVMIGAVALNEIVHIESALFAIVAYTVVLLCSLIKSNAQKTSPIRKAIRIGSLAKMGIGFVLFVAVSAKFHGLGLPVMTRDFANIVAEILAACALTVAVHRAARVGSRFARRDPTPIVRTESSGAVAAAAA